MRLNRVAPKPVEWLWHPYVPYGKISLVAGQMGQAKSLFTVWLADYAAARKGVNVLMLSAEDEPETELRPRFEALGADLDRIAVAPRNATLHGLGKLVDEAGGARLVTVDPISAYLDARVNSWKGQDVRLALEPLRQLAADRNIAVVLIQHLNRRADGDPLARIADSQGIPQLARSVMVWGPNPSDPEGDQGKMKVLSRAKCNLTRNSRESAAFAVQVKRVTSGIEAPYLVRDRDVQLAAEDVIADQDTRHAVDEAIEWLRILLADGPVPAKDVLRQARDNTISESTLKRAKRKLGVVSEEIRGERTIKGWSWRLPTYISDPLDTLEPLELLDKGVKGANKIKESTHTRADLDADAELERLQAKGLV